MRVIKLNTTDSTNNYAQKLIFDKNIETPFIVVANFQTQGKGQNNNVWLSKNKENILMTLVYDSSDIENSSLFLLNKAIAISVVQLLENFIPDSKVSIKWPNDIFVNNKKICGILIENCFFNSKRISLIGVGLNVNQYNFNDINSDAVSLFRLTKNKHNPDKLSIALSEIIINNLENLNKNSRKIECLYNSLLYMKNKSSSFILNGEIAIGKIISVDSQGRAEFYNKADKSTKMYSHGDLRYQLKKII